jgi:hypothetical protein
MNLDKSKVYLDKNWINNPKNLMFTWNEEFQYWAYINGFTYILEGKIQFLPAHHEVNKGMVSKVGEAILERDTLEVVKYTNPWIELAEEIKDYCENYRYYPSIREAGSALSDDGDEQIHIAIENFIQEYPELLHKPIPDKVRKYECDYMEDYKNSIDLLQTKINEFWKQCCNTSVCDTYIPPAQNQTKTKEKEMTQQPTLQEILTSIFGEPIPQTDYDKAPTYLIVVYSANGKEVATGQAESIEEIQETIQSDVRLWGCKVRAYKAKNELQTQVPVTIIKV